MTLIYDPVGSLPEAVSMVREVTARFPAVSTVYGYRPPGDGYDEHSTGLAEDFMTYTDKTLQYAVADYVKANAVRLHVEWIIRDQQIWSVERQAEGWRPMDDRGSPTANHKDHVHVKIAAGTYVPPEGSAPVTTTTLIWVNHLRFGMPNDPNVKYMQETLNSIRFYPYQNIPVTGTYDMTTDQCVRNWQKAIGDPIDPQGHSSIGPRQAAKLFAGKPVRLLTTKAYIRTPTGAIYEQSTANDLYHLSPGQYNALGSPRYYQQVTAPTPPTPSRPPANPTTGYVTTPFVGGRITYPFGVRNSAYAAGYHTGDDWACGTGTPLRTMWTCRVVGTGNVWGSAYGNQVVVQFTDYAGVTRQMAFCHLSRIDVKTGATLKPGDHIGLSGATGNVTGPHLHLEQRIYPFTYGAPSRKPVY